MIAIRRRTLIIKVLFFIVSLLSFSRLEDDTHIKCSYQNYLISVALKQANKQIFLPFVTFFRKDVIIVVGINLNTNFQMWFTHAPYLIDTRTFMIRVLICTNLWQNIFVITKLVQSEIDVNDNNIKLNNSAISQMKILENDKSIKELEILNKNLIETK